ncbi:HNH endonuclease signature motif containing protein [Kribbella steppae]|nr:HNH endonuclease signature motif containing protein [Kribbella steppae]
MSDSEKLSTLDAVFAEQARLKTIELQLIADFEQSGYAKEIGAGDTARLLSQRYRIDSTAARRDVHLADALVKHPATAAALPDPSTPFPNPASAHPDTDDPAASDGWRVHPAQAEAIVSVLAKVPTTVPVENVEFAERKLIDLAATHTPAELRLAGKKIRDILDPDGPEPDEKNAYARESLTLKNVDQGVNFRGFLANENAELFRVLIHTHARPHKTFDGELDPRPRDKRQADALTTILNSAADATPANSLAAASRASGSAADDAPASSPAAAGKVSGSAADVAPASSPAAAGKVSGSAADVAPASSPAAAGKASGSAADVAPANSPAGAKANGSAAGAVSAGAGTIAANAGAGQPPLPGITGPEQLANTGPVQVGRAGPGSVAGHGPKTHISVTIDFDALKAAAATSTGELVFGGTLSAAAIRRLACDAEVLPIVLGSKSQPLDVGTSERFVTRAMRRALNARDKGCVVCGAPPIQCEAHHLIHWIDGGVTAVSNLVLLCKRHHIDLHAGHWRIQIIDGVVHVARPTWASPDPIPRTRYRPLSAVPSPAPTSTTPGPPSHAHARPTDSRPAHARPTDLPPPAVADPSQTAVTDSAACSSRQDDSDGLSVAGVRRIITARAATVDPWGDAADLNTAAS